MEIPLSSSWLAMVAGVRKLQKFLVSDLRGARRVLMMLAPLVLLLERARSFLLRGFSSEPFFYACLLPPVAGTVRRRADLLLRRRRSFFSSFLRLAAVELGCSLSRHHLGGG
jgi:hypothetical protein